MYHEIPTVLQGVEHALAQQSKTSSAVAHSFDGFELVDFPFCWTLDVYNDNNCYYDSGDDPSFFAARTLLGDVCKKLAQHLMDRCDSPLLDEKW